MRDINFTQEALLKLMIMIGKGDSLKAITCITERVCRVIQQPEPDVQPKRNTYAEIAKALGMPARKLCEIPNSQLDIINEVKKIRQALRDAENDAKQDAVSIKLFRQSFDQMKEALGLNTGDLDSAVVAEVIEIRKDSGQMMHQIALALGMMPQESYTLSEIIDDIKLTRKRSKIMADTINKNKSSLNEIYYILKSDLIPIEKIHSIKEIMNNV